LSCIGTEERIAKLIDDVKKNGFNLKVENCLKDYLSRRMIETKNLNQITILQPHLINNLLNKFGNEVLGKRICRAPGTPRIKIIQPD
jgi:hypothetical protein